MLPAAAHQAQASLACSKHSWLLQPCTLCLLHQLVLHA
jgi:hypothetical protein